ncbi:MAG: ABC transporter ATP-binding protein, partial [Thermoproteota archaeon]
MPSVICRGLWKHYGSTVALRDVSFELKEGDFCLVAGPNGAGKTTLMRVLSGITQPSWGEAYVSGVSVRSAAVRARVGYLPEEAGVLGGLSVWRNTLLYARLSGYSGGEAERRAREALTLMGLWELRGRRAGSLSKGLARRLVLAQLLTRDAEVLLLDEPAAGLDVVSSLELRRFVRRLAD